jgi:hydroxyacylglutathione hydrolase
VVDPAVAEPVIAWLDERQLEPIAVLHTHHHHDHIGGTPALLRRWPQLQVIAAAADRQRIPFQTLGVGDGDRLSLLGRAIEVLAMPGHTRAHIAFYLPPVDGPADQPRKGDLFCGDTLFAGGCGRLLERGPRRATGTIRAAVHPDGRTSLWLLAGPVPTATAAGLLLLLLLERAVFPRLKRDRSTLPATVTVPVGDGEGDGVQDR